jgi:hypothetical protein
MNDQMFAAIDCWDVQNPCGVCRWCHPDYCGHCGHVGCNEIGGHPPSVPPPSVMPEEGVRVILFCLFFHSFNIFSLFRRTPFACGARRHHVPKRRRPPQWWRSSSSLASPAWWLASSARTALTAGPAPATRSAIVQNDKNFTTAGACPTRNAIFK